MIVTWEKEFRFSGIRVAWKLKLVKVTSSARQAKATTSLQMPLQSVQNKNFLSVAARRLYVPTRNVHDMHYIFALLQQQAGKLQPQATDSVQPD